VIEWSEEQQLARDAIRRFVEAEVVPHIEELEHGDLPPYDIIRKMYQTFGVDVIQTERFERAIERQQAMENGEEDEQVSVDAEDDLAIDQLLSIELCRHSSGIVTAMGVTQLAAGAIMSQGTIEQKKRWGLDLLTAAKVGSWAITEPGSGSDAFGGMSSTAKLNEDGNFVLKGSKTFITNGPYADTIVFICKLAEAGVEPRQRKIMTFILDRGMDGLEQSGRLRKMGLHSSPTGQLFLDNVVAGPERLLGGLEKDATKSKKKSDPRATFAAERVGVVSMSLGVVERCLELSVEYAKERVQWQKPIGEYQLIQLKLAEMEVARLNIQNMLFNYLERKQKGKPMSFAEASAMKLYSTQAAVDVASETIQLFGGNGYMAEYKVEQLYRDARVMRIYAGTDEMQVRAIARDLLSR
jgi:alkylation response protein AidB-like acyl-CoA dehydrogenase